MKNIALISGLTLAILASQTILPARAETYGDFELKQTSKQLKTNKQYVVYRNLNYPFDCLVVTQDSVVAAIYARVFGPASKIESIIWAKQNCTGPIKI